MTAHQRPVQPSSVRSGSTGKLLLVGLWVLILTLSACALRPAWQRLAVQGNLESTWIASGDFMHLQLWNGVQGSHLRIYIEGDGTPWISTNRVSIDPTPTNPVLLRLMHEVDHPAVYLGRPCYFGTSTDSGCDARWWTFERYSVTVIESMCEVANKISRQYGADTVQLVGYSGGGAIVVGMRSCTDRLELITTIAGNLDPAAWTEYHGYSSLHGESLIEGARSMRAGVTEVHWQCAEDENIPPEITDIYFAERPEAKRHIVDSCSHAAGWQQYFAQMVATVTTQ